MTTRNYGQETPVANQPISELTEINQNLNEELNDYDRVLHRLESVGHKLADTNTPKAASTGEMQKPVLVPGFVLDFSEKVEWLRKNNNRLRELAEKLEKII